MPNPTETFAAKFSTKYGFDISAIVSIVLALLENCPAPASEVQQTIKSPTLFQQARATRIVMKELGAPRWQARAIVDSLQKEAAAEDEAAVGAVLAECCSNNW